MTPFIAEYLGTMLLILMGGGVVANVILNKTKGHGAGWMAITTAWALGVFIGSWRTPKGNDWHFMAVYVHLRTPADNAFLG